MLRIKKMDIFDEYTEETIFNENCEDFNNIPEFTFEEHCVQYENDRCIYSGTLDLNNLNISFSGINLRFYSLIHEFEDESADVNAGFSKDGLRFEIVDKEGNVVLFNLEESNRSEYNWLEDFLDNAENYDEINPDNVCVIFCGEENDYWSDHSIVVNYGQYNGHDYKEYHFERPCHAKLSCVLSVVETECERDWIARGYTFVDGVGYRFETYGFDEVFESHVYNLTINDDPENEIDLSFLDE